MRLFHVLYYLALIGASAFVHAAWLSTTASQTINGIGASGAWWTNDLFHFPGYVKEQVASLLFSEDGLRLTSYRYNIGGGGVLVGNPTRAPETPFVSPGVYNFSADPQGVYFLKQAAAYKVPIITAFVNSAPPFFTSNNRSCGGAIVDSSIAGYTQYVTDVVKHWRSEGVDITYISPMNEPDNSFGSGDALCGQEGMAVAPWQRAPVINSLRTTLDQSGLQSVGIMADESSTTANFIPEVLFWLPSAQEAIATVSHHQYGFSDDGSVALEGSIGRNLSGGKDTWFTEICCYTALDGSQAQNPLSPLTYGQGYDPSIVGALQMASIMYQSFTQSLDAHFDWWTALSNQIGCDPTVSSTCIASVNSNGWNDGLLYYDGNATENGNFVIYTTKRFFVMKHFSQLIDVGAVRYDVQGVTDPVRALAFWTPARWTMLVMNMGPDATSFALPTGLGAVAQAFRTSATVDWEKLQDVHAFNVTLPALSITSFVFQ